MIEKDKAYYSQSDLLTAGWTKKLISDFLPAPVLKTNPISRSAAPMKTWAQDDVIHIVEREDFKAAFAKAQKRKEASQKAIATKKENLENIGKEFVRSIQIPVIDDDKLIQLAKQHAYSKYEEHQRERGRFADPFKSYISASDETVARWVVNYIRHRLTKYDKKLRSFSGKTGKDEVYIMLRNSLLQRIAEVYPKYADECIRQMYGDSHF